MLYKRGRSWRKKKKQESGGLTGALPVTVVLAMLAGLVFTHLSPYHEERPSARSMQARYTAAQDVDARLWQDPFAAVDGASEETSQLENANSSSHGRNQIYKGDPVTPRDNFTILAVTLPGGPYQEAAEDRMRRRYAVLSALANQEAVPLDEQHIGYFHPDRILDMDLQKRVSFEWWSLPDDKKKVLLLWVDESSLLKYPAAKLRELLCEASPSYSPRMEVSHYAVIGPNTSTLLQDMLTEVKDPQKIDSLNECTYMPGKNAAKRTLGKIEEHPIVYYSAGATASDRRLLTESIGQSIHEETVSEYLRNHGITLYRTSATDFDMMGILVRELEARRVKKTDHVVILSEWDTFYGRAMPKAFKRAWGNGGKDKTGETIVHVYGYMRGLDGKIPDKGDKASVNPSTEKKSDSKDKSEANALIEFPEGQNQKDYLRRLADTILELDQDLKAEDNPKQVAAIGVLGSDVHDKLMILEALRQHFPHKLFFTTDLDAAYAHPAKRPYTHNLLVAAAFDLRLRDELQDEIPTFRDSYQTAFFLAAQMVLNDENCIADQKLIGLFEETLDQHFPHKLFFITDLDAAYSHPDKWIQTHNPLEAAAYDLDRRSVQQDKIPPFRDSYQIELKEGTCITAQIGTPLPRLFEIGRSRSIPLPLIKEKDKASTIHMDGGNKSKCSWTNLLKCNSVHPPIFATSQLHWSGEVMMIIPMLAISTLVSWWVRKRIVSSFKYCLSHPYSVISVLLTFCLTTLWWNHYIIQPEAEPFFWLEGVSIWPSQLLRLLVALFAVGFFFWGHKRIQKMQKDLQAQRDEETQPTFALPAEPVKFDGPCDVLFVGSWQSEAVNNQMVVFPAVLANNQEFVFPSVLWKKYLGYCRNKKRGRPGWIWRVMIHGFAFFVLAGLLMTQTVLPNVPARGDCAHWINMIFILLLAVPSTIFLTMWVVENARLCERLIAHLSAKPSRWNNKARDWAIHDKKVAPECVNDWLDIQLVARLTATMQPLIWGPVVCIALLVSARSPAIDDWDLPWALEIVLMAMLLYAISAELFLQKGAKSARDKAIDQLTDKINTQRNLNSPDKVVIKRIETEIERIRTLREGAFKPWYEWPLLQSFGGLGTIVVTLQYFAGVWGNGTL